MPKRTKEHPAGNAEKIKKIKIQDVAFRLGDSVLIVGESEDHFVGKIKEFKAGRKAAQPYQVRVAWYYRPEECKAGRRVFHGEKELFESNHTDWIDAATISEKCDVYSLEDYKKLAETSDTEYYARYRYNPNKDEFHPEKVDTYCACDLPYNPDVFMLSCGQCSQWYHPRCIGLSDEEVGKFDSEAFICPNCSPETFSTEEK